jgi:hypothetical protein
VCVRPHYYKNPDGTYEDALNMNKEVWFYIKFLLKKSNNTTNLK